MKTILKTLKRAVYSDLKLIGLEAQRLGVTAYLVGGVVRDMLLNQPGSDWDIVVEGDAIELAKTIALHTKSKVTVYEQFGTATIHFPDGATIDFATARSEHYPHPGALPVVKLGSIKEDLFRRDFTINALAVSLNPENFGEILDFYGGLIDLQKKKIHILHDKSFLDDPTRILRAVRFESRLGFTMGKETLRLLKSALKSHAASTVKPPRYFVEFRKFFSEAVPVKGFRRLDALGGLAFINEHYVFPEKMFLKIQKSILALKKDGFFKSYDWSIVLLLCFFSKSTLQEIQHFSKRFHFTGKELESLKALVEVANIEDQLQGRPLKASQVYEILDPVDLEIIYFIRVATSVKIVASRIDDFLQKWRLISLEITGSDLHHLGVKQGRPMGVLLHTLLLKKIDGEIKSRHQEIVLAKELAAQNGSLVTS